MAKNKNRNKGGYIRAYWSKYKYQTVLALIPVVGTAIVTDGCGIPALIKRKLDEHNQRAVARVAIPVEIRHRLAGAKAQLDNDRPGAARLILNGQDSAHVANHRYINRPLSALLADLKALDFDWQGADSDALIRLAMSKDNANLPELISTLETTFLPIRAVPQDNPNNGQSTHPIFDFGQFAY
jgi:hypothetical protein